MKVTKDLLTRIENQQWKFADTYAETAPHEYIIGKWNSELFRDICHLIDTDGYEEMFYGKPFRYHKVIHPIYDFVLFCYYKISPWAIRFKS